MERSEVPVSYLFRMDARVGAPISVAPGPQGNRMILGVESGEFAGPRMRGTLLGGQGSEWATARADGSMKADVRLVLRTDDGADILMTYNGIVLVDEAGLRVRAAPLFETGSERYAWLNRVQAVSFGTPIENGVSYEVYEVGWAGAAP